MLHTRLVPGDRLSLTVAPKGFGSENMSRLQMLTPAAGRETILNFSVRRPDWREAIPVRPWSWA